MDRDHNGRSETTTRQERALLRSLARLMVIVVVLGVVALAGAIYGPALMDELEEVEAVDDVDIVDQPSPSSDPPPAGERDPEVTDPDDPDETTVETDVETVATDDVEDFVHAEVNDRRADHDIAELEWDGTVASVSRAHSHDMAERDYFDHINPDSEGPFDRFEHVDDYCRAYGENIAQTWVDRPVDSPEGVDTQTYETAEGLAEGLVDQWMNSTDHRDAILENHDGPEWDRGGVGVYIDDDGAVYASHNFCTER